MVLTDIKKGDYAIITGVKPSAIKDKLMEMGCVPGTPIHISLTAPLGDPIAYNVDGYFLSMRKSEAAQIEVKIAPADEG